MNKKITLGVIIIAALAVILVLIFLKPFNVNSIKLQNVIDENNEKKDGSIEAVFYDKTNKQTKATFYKDSVVVENSDLGKITLNHAMSGSGARYTNQDESIVFWNKGDNVTIWKNDKIIFEGSTKVIDLVPKRKLPTDGI